MYLPLFGATQAQIQRYNSVPTLRQSRQYVGYSYYIQRENFRDILPPITKSNNLSLISYNIACVILLM